MNSSSLHHDKKRKRKRKRITIHSGAQRQHRHCHNRPDRDHYVTPLSTWKKLEPFLHRSAEKATYWMPFFADGACETALKKDLGFNNVVHTQQDFFSFDKPPEGVTCILDNPPYSCKKKVLRHLQKLDIPFALFLPLQSMCRKYWIETFGTFGTSGKDVKYLIPYRRLNFIPINETLGHQVNPPKRNIMDVVLFCYKFPLNNLTPEQEQQQVIYF